MRKATVELGITIPDYVTNTDVYKATDAAAQVYEQAHIEAEDLNIYGLDFEAEEEYEHDDSL